MSLIGAGDLDRRVTIQRPTTTRGETGGPEASWAALAAVWAKVRDLSGKETFSATAAGSDVSRVVTIRYRTDVSDAMRILFEDGAFARIAWKREIGRKLFLEIYCEMINER
jgi:SPP1 family predicted phage head-tail adaptor